MNRDEVSSRDLCKFRGEHTTFIDSTVLHEELRRAGRR